MPGKRPNRLTAWIACIAILLGALAPTVSFAVSWASGGELRWVEVCTTSGVKLVPVDADRALGEDGSSSDGLFAAERCPLCFIQGGLLALPPSPGMSLPVLSGRDPFSAVHYRAPPPLFLWAASNPRAPPALA